MVTNEQFTSQKFKFETVVSSLGCAEWCFHTQWFYIGFCGTGGALHLVLCLMCKPGKWIPNYYGNMQVLVVLLIQYRTDSLGDVHEWEEYKKTTHSIQILICIFQNYRT